MKRRLIGILLIACLAPLPASAPAPASAMTSSVPTAPATGTRDWDLVVDDQFNSGPVPKHWVKYDGPYGSGPHNCARPSHAFVKSGSLHLVLRYRASGGCGPGWYSAGMKLAKRFESVDQRISVRFRVKSVGGITGHRIIPMRWPSSNESSSAGEEDYCEGSPLHDCLTFLHYGNQRQYHRYSVDLTRLHTMTFVRRGFTVRAFIDGVRRWVYHGNQTTLPATLKRPVLQQECQHDGCPMGTRGREIILIKWIKVWNPAAASSSDSGVLENIELGRMTDRSLTGHSRSTVAGGVL